MQDARFGKSARGRDAILYRCDRASRTPHIIHDQRRAAAQFIFRRKLNELGPSHQPGFAAFRLRGKIHCGGEDVRDVHRIRQQAAGDDAAARDHHHRRIFASELRDEMIDEAIHLIPCHYFTSSLWLHTEIQLESVAPTETPENLAIVRVGPQGRVEQGRPFRLEVEVGNFSPSPRQVTAEVTMGEAQYRLQGICTAGGNSILVYGSSIGGRRLAGG